MVHLSGSRVWDENSGEEEEGMMLAEPPGRRQLDKFPLAVVLWVSN